MLPEFPNFKYIDVFDRELVEAHTKKLPPYSDFNFTSLWLWDIEEKRMISQLNGNLVVLFTDYQTGEPTISMLGTNQVDDSVKRLIEYCKLKKISTVLNYIAEETADNLTSSNYRAQLDTQNIDYIFSTHKITDSLGKEMKSKRRLAKKFKEEHPNATFEIATLSNIETQEKVRRLFNLWISKKISKSKDYESSQEPEVIERLFKHPENSNFVFSFLYDEDELIGFAADEILPNAFAISHVAKADTSYKGVYEFLNEKTAQALLTRGVLYWNWEQDLGVESLHATKSSYKPVALLKKYRISPASFLHKIFQRFSR
jgi:hypothetical protein